jgi:hypothetical protein
MVISALPLSGGAVLREPLLGAVKRAFHPPPALVQHMGVDHRGRDVLVAEQLLHRADVVASLQNMGCERMAPMPISA